MDNIFTKYENFLNLINSHSGSGSPRVAGYNAMYGLNNLSSADRIQGLNKDKMGYVFFTRPQLNLSDSNILMDVSGIIRNIKVTHENSNLIQNAVRCYLDPRLMVPNGNDNRRLHCDLINNENPFISILSNSCLSLSGWPDKVTPTFESAEGARGEVHSMIDGSRDYLQSFDLDATFMNFEDSCVHMLFNVWGEYGSQVFEGTMYPYIDFLVNNEIDYNTRIYRFVMDHTDTYIKQFFACGAAYPITTSESKFADYDSTKFYNINKDINVRFRCLGAEYNRPITLLEFNMTVAAFNSSIMRCIRAGQKPYENNSYGLIKVTNEYRKIFNYKAIPYINLETNELCWIIDQNDPTVRELMKYNI